MYSGYHKRIVDDYFKSRLEAAGAILIEGPKWCGKTSTGERLSSSSIYLQDPDEMKKNLYYAENKPSVLLEGETPRLIDEWQVAPQLWNAVRFAVDKRKERSLFILTGSSAPAIGKEELKTMHTGTGRISRVRMRTLSLYESDDSVGSVSLRELFENNNLPEGDSDMKMEDLAYLTCRGGWPSNYNVGKKNSLRTPSDYVESVINYDTGKFDGTRKNPETTRRLMESLSRNICTMADTKTVAKDMGDIDRRTVTLYVNSLKSIFVIEDTPAWGPSLISKARLRTSPKRNFVDPSIATATLNTNPKRLVSDHPSFGAFFESLCIRDLRVYSQPLDGRVYHYSDDAGLEADAIIELPDGRWGALEIKLAGGEETAAKNLKKLAEKTVLVNKIKPSFLAIVTGTGFAHRRTDGVLVIPIGCLKD